MPRQPRRASAIALTALIAVGLAACGSSSSSNSSSSSAASTTATSSATSSTSSSGAPATVIGRSTAVTVNPVIAAALKKASITVAPVAPATAKKVVFVFPESGGQVVVATLAGTINHTGGLTFSHAGKSVTLTNFVINTTSKQLTATAGGGSLPVFDLGLASLKRVSGPGGTIVATNIKLDLTSQAASALNSGLGVTLFKGGMHFGIATLTVAVKP